MGLTLVALLAVSSASAAIVESLPPAMIGYWGWDAKSCANPEDDGRVTVYAREVDFSAGGNGLTRIEARPDGSIRATAIHHDEGSEEATDEWLELRLTESGSLTIETGSGLDNTYVRCGPLQ